MSDYFKPDDEILSPEDLTRHHFLTGFELNRRLRRAAYGGFLCCIGSLVLGVLLVWFIRWLFGI